jgi:hypothetical protein
VLTPPTYASTDDREECPLGPSPRFEQAREVRPVAELRDLQVDRADPGVPAPLAVAVALGQAALRDPFTVGRPDLGRHLGVHDQLGEHRESLTQEVEVAVTGSLAQQFEGGHPVVGHRVHLFRRRLQLQRREDDSVASSLAGPDLLLHQL